MQKEDAEDTGETAGITVLKGGIPDDLRSGSLVLIGDDLARRLFLTLDCIGSQFTIDVQAVTVAGIYAESCSLLHRISGDGRKLVFVLNGDMDSTANRVIVQTNGALYKDYAEQCFRL